MVAQPALMLAHMTLCEVEQQDVDEWAGDQSSICCMRLNCIWRCFACDSTPAQMPEVVRRRHAMRATLDDNDSKVHACQGACSNERRVVLQVVTGCFVAQQP